MQQLPEYYRCIDSSNMVSFFYIIVTRTPHFNTHP